MATDDAPTADPDELGYAQALAELEEILDALEDDTVDGDRLATQVQRAAELIRICRGRIRDARVDVEQIVADLEEA
jgi:exodeoxyribonuclease VII small subunit